MEEKRVESASGLFMAIMDDLHLGCEAIFGTRPQHYSLYFNKACPLVRIPFLSLSREGEKER